MNAHCHDYPDEPGHRGVSTSIEAAEAVAPAQGRLQRVALEAIRDAGYFGLTAEELANRLGMPREAIQPRTTELRRKGLIDDRGVRRPNRSGKRAIAWVAVPSEVTHG